MKRTTGSFISPRLQRLQRSCRYYLFHMHTVLLPGMRLHRRDRTLCRFWPIKITQILPQRILFQGRLGDSFRSQSYYLKKSIKLFRNHGASTERSKGGDMLDWSLLPACSCTCSCRHVYICACSEMTWSTQGHHMHSYSMFIAGKITEECPQCWNTR